MDLEGPAGRKPPPVPFGREHRVGQEVRQAPALPEDQEVRADPLLRADLGGPGDHVRQGDLAVSSVAVSVVSARGGTSTPGVVEHPSEVD